MLRFKIARKRHTAATLGEASRIYAEARDASGLGASRFRDATIFDASGQPVARISYNAKVWPPYQWHAAMRPIYNPAGDRDPFERAEGR